MEFTEEEQKLLKKYQSLSTSVPSLINRVAVEIVPPVIFVTLGIYAGKIIWFIVLILLMVIYNVQRVIRQHKNIEKLNSISKKTIGNIDEGEKT
jgi:hypothetical protein